MSLSGGTAGGKGVDSNAVDTYDSGDEWDIGVGNLIIDLDADLEKDKLEMSGTKDGGGMAAPPSAVAALPDNIKFVSPVSAPQGKESKSKSKRNGAKKEHQGRTQGEVTGATGSSGGGNSATGKGAEKGAKASRGVPNSKKEKEVSSGKNKKEKCESAPVAVVAIEKEIVVNAQAFGSTRNTPFDNTQNADIAVTEQLGNNALETVGIVSPLAIKSEPEELDGECRVLKKMKNEKVSADGPLVYFSHLAATANCVIDALMTREPTGLAVGEGLEEGHLSASTQAFNLNRKISVLLGIIKIRKEIPIKASNPVSGLKQISDDSVCLYLLHWPFICGKKQLWLPLC
ncbi:hypothetical protein PO909_023264 [Leuciscus waleckii]